MKQKIKIALVLAVVASGCAVLKKTPKNDCVNTGASSLDLKRTGFVPVSLGFPWAEQNTFQIQLTDTSEGDVLSNHTALCFSKEKPEVEKSQKVMPAASLCCVWDSKNKFFSQSTSVKGVTQSVLWAYGKQASLPAKYTEHLAKKKQGKDNRTLAYAVYSRHVIWPVTLKKDKKNPLQTFQVLLQKKDENHVVTSSLVTIVGMDVKSLESMLYNNTSGVVFEISEKEFDSKTKTWVDPGQGDGQIFTLGWNAEEELANVTNPIVTIKKQAEGGNTGAGNSSTNNGSGNDPNSKKKTTTSGGLRK